jgi:anaerobic ribonucleoside-triphosphate reductase
VAKEAEKRLLKSRTKYLTAPLVREVVNAILIEKGLEDYRHKLTRVGLPVHYVTELIEKKTKASEGSASVPEKAGETVLEEYTLLNVLPRDIGDAHLSGSLHITGLGDWILKPSEVMHDLRFFFQNGLNQEKTVPLLPSFSPPQNFESALSMVFNVLLHSAKEVSEAQTFEYFNVFLAPFTKGSELSRVKEVLRLLISNMSQHAAASLALELVVPSFVAEKPAFGPFGKPTGNYGSFVEESQSLASLILEIFAEDSGHRPLFNPKIILKIRPETFTDEKAKALLLKAHGLASEKGTPYFANLSEKSQQQSVFSVSGCKLEADLNGDWEIDTLRTGCLGIVAVNLPRITYECEKDKAKFFELLKETLEMATRTLEIKYRAVRQHSQGLLPFLMQSTGGDQYFRLENCSSIINLVGLREAAEAFYGKSVYDDAKTQELVEETIRSILAFIRKIGRRRGKRLLSAVLPDFEASERLARLDIERYGVAKVRFSGTRDKPFYSTLTKLSLHDGTIPPDPVAFEGKFADMRAGGSLAAIDLGQADHKAEDLMSLTKHSIEDFKLEFFTYTRDLTYCTNCKKSWFGLLHKCPSCGATSTLSVFKRLPYW